MTTICKYGCQTAIKFDNTRVSTRGIKIPLNLDGTPHDCPSNPFNKARLINCKYCNQQITFNDKVTSERGKKIPLNPDGSPHDCPQHTFNETRSGNNKYEVNRLDFAN